MLEKILIVDDDPDTIEFLRILMVRQGYRPLVAEDGITALELANQHIPDLNYPGCYDAWYGWLRGGAQPASPP